MLHFDFTFVFPAWLGCSFVMIGWTIISAIVDYKVACTAEGHEHTMMAVLNVDTCSARKLMHMISKTLSERMASPET